MSEPLVTLENLDEVLIILRQCLDETPKDTPKHRHYLKLEELYTKILDLDHRITRLEEETK